MNTYASRLNQYNKVNQQTGIVDADPHRLIQLLYNALKSNLSKARGHMERREFEDKGKMLTKSVEILSALSDCLDRKHNPELVDNLAGLYDYCARQLMQANLQNEMRFVDEVVELITPVQQAWDDIRDEVVHTKQEPMYNGASATA
jgi:flagellar protein FliS